MKKKHGKKPYNQTPFYFATVWRVAVEIFPPRRGYARKDQYDLTKTLAAEWAFKYYVGKTNDQ